MLAFGYIGEKNVKAVKKIVLENRRNNNDPYLLKRIIYLMVQKYDDTPHFETIILLKENFNGELFNKILMLIGQQDDVI